MKAAPFAGLLFCNVLATFVSFGLLYLVFARECARNRWDACARSFCMGLFALEILGFFGIAPTMHWLAPPDASATRIILAAGIALAASAWALVYYLKPPTISAAVGAILVTAIPFLHFALAWRMGWGQLENSDSFRYMLISGDIVKQGGLMNYLLAGAHSPANGFDFALIPALWLPYYRVAGWFTRDFNSRILLADRMLSLCFMELALWSTCLLGGRMFGRRAGFWSAIVLGLLMPAFSFYGVFYFVDVPLAATLCLAVYLSYWAATQGDFGMGVLAGVLLCACAFIKLSGVYAILLCLLLPWFSRGGRKWQVIGVTGGTALLLPFLFGRLALGLPFGVLLRLCAAKSTGLLIILDHYYLRRTLPSFAALDPLEPLRWNFYLKHLPAYAGFSTALLATLACAVLGTRQECIKKVRDRRLLFMGVWAVLWLVIVSLFQTKDERFVLCIFPPLAIIGGCVLSSLAQRVERRLFAALVAQMIVLGLMHSIVLLSSFWKMNDFSPIPERAYGSLVELDRSAK